MAYEPQFTISARLLSLVEEIAVLRERIQGAAVSVSWIPALQKDTRTRNGHASTAIEGNPLTLEQVRALEEGRELAAADRRSSREVLNYFAGLRYVERMPGRRKSGMRTSLSCIACLPTASWIRARRVATAPSPCAWAVMCLHRRRMSPG